MLQHNLSKVIKNDVNLLITLYFLLKTRQVSKAAQQLFLGQPAVSHQLARLRQLFDDPLLVRSAGEMMLTPFAKRIFPSLELIVTDLELLLEKRSYNGYLRPMKHIYRVCVPEDVYIDEISLLLYGFTLQQGVKDVAFEVFTRYDQCISDLNDGNIDFFFGYSDKLSKNVCEVELIEIECFLTVRPGHPFAEKTVELNEVIEYPWIEILFRERIKSLSEELWGEAIMQMNCSLKTSSARTAIALLRHSNAISVFTEDVIDKYGLSKVNVKG
ncbi:LysR family transcriptional regulator, partial [Salmonella enterica]|nr:LysR family transcriptional regulator [Salmonella enterica]